MNAGYKKWLGAYMLLVAVILTWVLLELLGAIPPVRPFAALLGEATAAAATPASGAAPAAAEAPPPLEVGPTVALVLVLGALGAQLQALLSLADYLGNKKFEPSWTFYYLKRPFVGGLIALLVFAALNGGMMQGSAGDDPGGPASPNVWGTMALGLMSGLFSRQAMDKLGEVFAIVFAVRPEAKVQREDALVEEPTEALVTPVLAAVSPTTAVAHQEQPLELTGSGFDKDCTVSIDGKPAAVEFISETQLRATLPASEPKEITILVSRPGAPSPDSEAKVIVVKPA